jgi:hypothetical protein
MFPVAIWINGMQSRQDDPKTRTGSVGKTTANMWAKIPPPRPADNPKILSETKSYWNKLFERLMAKHMAK